MASLPVSILVPVDFGTASARATELGGFIADRAGAALRLLHAETTEAPAYFTHDQIQALERQRLAVRRQAEQFLAQFGRQHTRHAVTVVVDDRRPSDAILHESESADLVVMGTHGRTGPARWWLGSVAERVVRHTLRPLLVVRAEMREPVDAIFGRVLVHAAAPLTGEATMEYLRLLAGSAHGDVVDARLQPIEHSMTDGRATLIAIAAPTPRSPAWLSVFGEPLVRLAAVPILFVPETQEGVAL
jgi:nucleotide-binding universal stress UspA family protein